MCRSVTLTQAGADHKRRIKDLVRQLVPMTPLTGDLGIADLAVLSASPTRTCWSRRASSG